MSINSASDLISVEVYLDGEKDSDVRHEYVAGHIFAMTGASAYHNRIALALASALRGGLIGSPCDVFMSDMKVKAAQAYYYPDVMVVCDSKDNDLYTRNNPIFIAEVMSATTRSIDLREKRLADVALESLEEYLLLEQDRAEARLIRREEGERIVELTYGLDDVISLKSLDLSVAMQGIYEGAWR
jgi:Uma2 family endonuclease